MEIRRQPCVSHLLALLAFRQVVDIFPEDENVKLAILNAASLAKSRARTRAMDCGVLHPTGIASCLKQTTPAHAWQSTHYIKLGEDLEEYLPALKSLLNEFKKEGRWRTINETYTFKYFGEGLDQRLIMV